jgi:riboflavin kinase/FMN adenylyltransferase
MTDVYEGVANIGRNPTFGGAKMSYEVHLFGYQGNLLGRGLRLHFLERIRDERRFSSAGDLKRQIQKEIEAARLILSRKSTPLYL